MIKNIIFDWSGTLSDNLLQVYKATMAVFEAFNAKKLSLEEYREEFELPYMNFYKRHIPKITPEEQGKIFREAIRKTGEPKPFDGARECLDLLFKKGIKMMVLSAHPKAVEEARSFGFSRFFGGMDENRPSKATPLREMLETYGFKAEETAFVGDAEHDMGVGKKAGLTTIAVSWGFKPRRTLEKVKPDFIVDRFDQLNKIIIGE